MIPKRKRKPAKFQGLPFALPVRKRGEDKKALEKECLELWSVFIRLRDKYCRYCKKVHNFNDLYAHHIYSVACKATKFDPENGICLCFKCHIPIAHRLFETFRRWLLQNWMSLEKYEALGARAETRMKYTVGDLKLIKMDLKQKIERMGGRP
jgi:hypothetical protein